MTRNVTIWKGSRVVSLSHNSREFCRYAAKHKPLIVLLEPCDDPDEPCRLTAYFNNGTVGFAYFADPEVAATFVLARRSWMMVRAPSTLPVWFYRGEQ